MEVMERLYYERKEKRQTVYTTKRKKTNRKKGISSKKSQMKQDSDIFDKIQKQSIYNMC